MWSEEKKLFPVLVSDAPHPETGIIVAVPCYNEPAVTSLLDSLASCTPPQCRAEILLVLNAPTDASGEAIENNKAAVDKANDWLKQRKSLFFRLYTVDLGRPDFKKWGVGMARKAGMDEALSRFLATGRRNGVIVSLDADCTVEKNYFLAIENELLNRDDRRGCSIYFEHPLSGKDYQPEIYDAAARYELHLRYFYQALRYAGYPWVFHTVGSCMAVKAYAYMLAGGMNRRQAGEDFYFIQKLLPAGGYFSLNDTAVYPSPRVSSRVPFGTGAAVSKMVRNGAESYLTYSPLAFEDIRTFFRKVTEASNSGEDVLCSMYFSLPLSVREYLEEEEWKKKITEIKSNTSLQATFKKRFFTWFNMFRIIKFLNFTHTAGIFTKKSPQRAAEALLEMSGRTGFPSEVKELLLYLRNFERKS